MGFEEGNRQHGDDGGNEESPSEVVRVARLAKVAADQRGEEGTHVDTHIEDGVGGIQPFVARLVELPHQRGDGGLEAAVAQYKESQSAVHQPMRKLTCLQHRGAGEHQELADCHHHRSPEDGTADAPVFVGNVAANQRCQIDQSGVAAVDGGGVLLVEKKCLGEKQDEDGTHAVVTETLCRAGGEDKVKTFGMSGCTHSVCSYCFSFL